MPQWCRPFVTNPEAKPNTTTLSFLTPASDNPHLADYSGYHSGKAWLLVYGFGLICTVGKDERAASQFGRK